MRGSETPNLPQRSLRRLIRPYPCRSLEVSLPEKATRGCTLRAAVHSWSGERAAGTSACETGRQLLQPLQLLLPRQGSESPPPETREEMTADGRNAGQPARGSQPAAAQHVTRTKQPCSSSCLHVKGQLSVPKHLNASTTKTDPKVNKLGDAEETERTRKQRKTSTFREPKVGCAEGKEES